MGCSASASDARYRVHVVKSVQVGNYFFDYLEDGDADAPVVLLLHGFPQDSTSWDAISADLVAAGYRTLRLDQRGYSSGARPGSVNAYRMPHLVADAFGFLDALKVVNAHVIGHDWGGAVAWAMAEQAPERLISLTVLSTPHPAALASSMIRSTQGIKSWYMAMFQAPMIPERLLAPGGQMWSLLTRGLPRESREHYAQRARQPGALTAMLHWYRAAARAAVRRSAGNSAVSVRTLYVWGARDPALGSYAAERTGRYVCAPYVFHVLSGHGHWLPERAAGQLRDPILRHLNAE
jgi:pimeloyl-ACP methyl ester carboxylesterase